MDYQAACDYILQLLASGLSPDLIYHNYDHTVDVWQSTREIAKEEGLTEEERIIAETAALFHDAGMLNYYTNHEKWSAEIAAEALPGFGFSSRQVQTIRELILATRLPQQPSTLLEKVICDADLDYLGSQDFIINSFKLKLEWQLYGVREYTLQDWFQLQDQFLSTHRFFTSISKQRRDKVKKKNLEFIRSVIVK